MASTLKTCSLVPYHIPIGCYRSTSQDFCALLLSRLRLSNKTKNSPLLPILRFSKEDYRFRDFQRRFAKSQQNWFGE